MSGAQLKAFAVMVAAGVAATLLAAWLSNNVRAVRRATGGI